ncbi:MAG: acyltransferase [Clostridiales bacterium]|nr:acyltransferase [Clostridiales bacterium]
MGNQKRKSIKKNTYIEKKWLDELPLLVSFYCFIVILNHLMSAPVNQLIKGSWQYFVFFVFNKINHFVVPGFIFLSGLKLSFSYRHKEFHYGEFLKKRVTKVLIPYAFWFIVYYVYFLMRGFIEPKSLFQLIKSFFLGDMVSPFYYITITIQLYLLYGIIHYLFQKFSSVSILAGAIVINLLMAYFGDFIYSDRFFGLYLIYFVIGCYAAFDEKDFTDLMKSRFYVYLVAAVIFGGYHLYASYQSVINGVAYSSYRMVEMVFYIFAVLTTYGISQRIYHKFSQRQNKFFVYLDKSSYYIYLSHTLAIYICENIWHDMGQASIIGRFCFSAIIVYLTVPPLCIFYIWIKKKILQKKNV